MKRLNTLVPNGLNSLTFNDDPLHLVLPHSNCSARVLHLVQKFSDNVTVRGSYRANRNLRSLLRSNQ